MQKYIFFFESQIFVPIFVPLPSALLISESRKQSVVKSVFLCLFTVLCMAVLSMQSPTANAKLLEEIEKPAFWCIKV